MTAQQNSHGADQRPNMWEELNRPGASQRRVVPDAPAPSPPPPTAPSPPSPTPPADASAEATTTTEDDDQTSPAARAMEQLDPQHLLLVGAALFIIVAFFAVRGLGSSDLDTTSSAAATAAPSPAQLAAVDDVTTTTAPPTPETTEAEVEAMAMGLPAALLDSPQSQVFRLYRTALGREPDRNGFTFWSDQIRSGVALEQLANEFLASVEYQEQFGSGDGWDDRAELLLTNAFGAPADDAQLDAWRARFTGLDGAELLLAISESDETLEATGTLP